MSYCRLPDGQISDDLSLERFVRPVCTSDDLSFQTICSSSGVKTAVIRRRRRNLKIVLITLKPHHVFHTQPGKFENATIPFPVIFGFVFKENSDTEFTLSSRRLRFH